jgi:hypothetical protein
LSNASSSMLTVQQVFDAFDRAENELPVSNWDIGGLLIWPLFRVYFGYFLLTRRVANSDSQITRYGSYTNRLRQIGVALLEQPLSAILDRKHNDIIRNSDVVILSHSSTRYFKVDGAWYNPYSDSLVRNFKEEGIDSLVLELTAEGRYLVPRYAPSVFVQNRAFYASLCAKFGALINWPKYHEKLDGWDILVKIFSNLLGAANVPNLDNLRFRARQVLAYEDWFSNVLKRVNPKIGLLTGYYSVEMMGFIRACRKLEITTFEIQHGVQGDKHIAYHRWSNIPAGGYDTLPNIFWSWTDEEACYINSWAKSTSGSHKAIVGGNPCLNIYDKQGDVLSHSMTKIQSKRSQQIDSSTLQVLFTAQADNFLPLMLIDAIKNTPNWTWWIRTHPQYWEARESIKKQCFSANLDNVFIDEASDSSLASLLSQVDVHVTAFSSSVLEAESLGVSSVVIDLTGVAIFPSQIESGVAVFAEDSLSLVAKIEVQAQKRIIITDCAVSQECFFGSVMEIIKNEISKSN